MNISNTYEKATNELLETELVCAFEKIWEDLEFDEKIKALRNEKIDSRFYGSEEVSLDLFFQDSTIEKRFEILSSYGKKKRNDKMSNVVETLLLNSDKDLNMQEVKKIGGGGFMEEAGYKILGCKEFNLYIKKND